MTTALIYGSGRLGIQIGHLVRNHFSDAIQLAGFIDDTKPAGLAILDDLKTMGGLADVAAHNDLSPTAVSLIFGIGYSDMSGRIQAFSKAVEAGYELVTLIHPAATIEPTVEIGSGTIIQAGAVIDNCSQVGAGCFIDIGVLVSEFCEIGDNNFIAAGTAIGGYTAIGHSNFIGMNCTIADNLTVGNNNLVNAQTLVYKELSDDTKVVEFHDQHEMKRV